MSATKPTSRPNPFKDENDPEEQDEVPELPSSNDADFGDDLMYDFTGLTDRPVITAGTYLARVENVERKYSKNGNNMYVIGFRLMDAGDFEGMRITHYMTFSEKTANMAFEDLAVILGHPIPRGPYKGDQDDQDELTDKVVKVRIAIGSYLNKPKPEIRGILPATARSAAAPF